MGNIHFQHEVRPRREVSQDADVFPHWHQKCSLSVCCAQQSCGVNSGCRILLQTLTSTLRQITHHSRQPEPLQGAVVLQVALWDGSVLKHWPY